jgi:hypothetical protein
MVTRTAVDAWRCWRRQAYLRAYEARHNLDRSGQHRPDPFWRRLTGRTVRKQIEQSLRAKVQVCGGGTWLW